MIRLIHGPFCQLFVRLCVLCLGFANTGCTTKSSEINCLSAGTSSAGIIDGGEFLEEILNIYGLKFSREFMRRRVIERKAKTLNVTLPEGQLASEMILTERDFFASHSGEKAAVKHLMSYGLELEDWRRLTSDRVRYGLLAKQLMRIEPSQSMIDELFEKRYGQDGERREIRYLHVSTAPTSQSILQGETLKGALKAFEEKMRKRLSIVVQGGQGDIAASLKTVLAGYKYTRVTDLRNTDLPLDLARNIAATAPGVWSEIISENEQLKVVRRVEGPNSKSMAGARFERIIIPVSSAQLLSSDLATTVRSGAKSRAEKLFGQINKSPRSFSIHARARSDHGGSKQRGGRFRIFQPKNAGLSTKVTDTILKLATPGQLVMVEDTIGFHIVRLESLQRVNQSKVIKELREEMQRRAYSDSQVNTYVDELVEEASFKINLELDPRCRAKARVGQP